MAGEIDSSKPSSVDPRLRSFSLACPADAQRTASMLASGASSSRRGSRALDVRGAKSVTPLSKWISDHVDKQIVGLGINFLILVVLLMLLKVVVQWIQLTQQASRQMHQQQQQQAAASNAD